MKLWETLLDLLYPPRCVFCRKLLPDGVRGVCRECTDKLPRVPDTAGRRDLKGLSDCFAPLYYTGLVRDSLLRYKFHALTGYGQVYAAFIAKSIDESSFSCDSITWVPLSRKRLRRRGYDQARILAEELAARLDLPCERLLDKIVDTRAQSSTTSAEQRRRNAAGVYRCTDPARAANKRILLVDDIVTTGATLEECARVLRAAGAADVAAACVATRS